MIRIPHEQMVRSSITISILTLDRFIDGAPILGEDSGNLRDVDLLPFASRLLDTLRRTLMWRSETHCPVSLQRLAALPDAQVPPLPMLDDYPEPSVVGEVASEVPGDALVPLLPQVQLRSFEVHAFLQDLVARGAVEGESIPDVSLLQVPHRLDIVLALRDAGVVALNDDGFGDFSIRVNRRSLMWTHMIKTAQPCSLFRVRRKNVKLLQLTKLELVAQLFYSGWRPQPHPLPAWHRDGPLYLLPDFSRPISYFAALLDSERITAKIDTTIAHDGNDGYYRCLLQLDQAKLLALMNVGMEDKPYEWYMQALKDCPDASDTDTDESVSPRPILDHVDEGPPDVQEGQIVRLEMNTWDRASVFIRGRPLDRVKVYFDQCHISTGQPRRGFAWCSQHHCHKWRPVSMAPSRDAYLAWMLLWFLKEVDTKEEHLAYVPSDEEIAAIIPQLVREPF